MWVTKKESQKDVQKYNAAKPNHKECGMEHILNHAMADDRTKYPARCFGIAYAYDTWEQPHRAPQSFIKRY